MLVHVCICSKKAFILRFVHEDLKHAGVLKTTITITKADLAYFTDQCILEGMFKIHVRSHVLIIHNAKFSIHRLNAMGKMLNYVHLK